MEKKKRDLGKFQKVQTNEPYIFSKQKINCKEAHNCRERLGSCHESYQSCLQTVQSKLMSQLREKVEGNSLGKQLVLLQMISEQYSQNVGYIWSVASLASSCVFCFAKAKKKNGPELVAIRRSHDKAHLRNAAEVVHSESCMQAGRA